ncbi:RHS repeat domain-containing protein [Shewanella phaeophyticola]|uniref:RHS repeat-associated core domain-containing protein n=1 Tax=Shewanella phaeophyticola TaxID=2978345 RepID=A0ABT2NZY3_9GAMM|nr:RHS repeat-associated core domain-containing protein [Shewanella sp. KJ10-1]MCT8985950.1 hypothetical protein [Shewanella sp. KJ10-1]
MGIDNATAILGSSLQQFGRIKAMQYPSGEHVAYRFDDNGYLVEDYQRFTDGSEQSLRIIDEYSAFGSINQQTFSNNYVQQFSRNLAGSPTSICTSSSAGCSTIGVQYLNYDYDGMGNLAFQHNVITQFKESYNYDELMRVDDSTKTYKGITYAAVNYDYDAAGNILVKGDYGSQYLYGSVGKGAGGNAGSNAIRQFIRGGTKTFTYDNNGNRLTGDGVTLSYNDQNKPLTVDRNNVKSTFSYDANGNRYKQVKQQNGSVVSTTYYVGSFEREVTLSSTVDKTYIGDHTIKMKAHVGSLGNQSPFQHVLRDHLGSVDTLMDAKTGAVLQHRGYDVFGRPRDIASGNALLSSWQGVTKGYTDHEHLVDQELIHMNGRIYDFNVGRFLSVDPFLQFPENSQSANPYSYILNNPMSGVDPTGYRSEELDEVISGKAFEKLEKDEGGNLYVTADGDTYKLTSVSNGEKNFSISFDGNGGGTAQVGKTTGTISLHKGNSSTNSGKAAASELIGKINKEQLGSDSSNSQKIFDEAYRFFKDYISNMGETVEFKDAYAVSIRNAADHSETYAPIPFDNFDDANEYAEKKYGEGYEKVWVFGYHYGGKSTIYKPATFSGGGYTGVQRTIATLAHESRHYNRYNISLARPHNTLIEHRVFEQVSLQAVDRYNAKLSGEKNEMLDGNFAFIFLYLMSCKR